MTTPEGPRSDAPPPDPPAWGEPPAGGWGAAADHDPDRTEAVDPRVWRGAVPDPDRTERVDPAAWRPSAPGPPPPYPPQGWGGPPPPQYGAPQSPPRQAPPPPYAPPQGGPGGWRPSAGQPAWNPPPPPPNWGPPTQSRTDPAPEPAASTSAAPEKRRSRLPLILGVLAVLVAAVVLVLGFVTPGFFVTKVFDTAAVQSGVQRVLTENYQVADVSGVVCGPDIKVVQGATFTCEATIAGTKKSVQVRITSNAGDYEVGRPT